MSKYQHIIFDLDHTLWDFDANCRLALAELYTHHCLDKLALFSLEMLYDTYRQVNEMLWDNLQKGLDTKDEIRLKRFHYTFEQMGIDLQHLPATLNEEFINLCPTKGQLMAGAKELLDYLHPKYKLHILTNGFSESQYLKMDCAGITSYFEHIVLAEQVGTLKPHAAVFDHTVTLIGGTKANTIMVGDSLHADVLGAKNAGLDHVYYNPYQVAHNEDIQFEIFALDELHGVL
jgi:putative hydrolase of the HAD superfamily